MDFVGIGIYWRRQHVGCYTVFRFLFCTFIGLHMHTINVMSLVLHLCAYRPLMAIMCQEMYEWPNKHPHFLMWDLKTLHENILKVCITLHTYCTDNALWSVALDLNIIYKKTALKNSIFKFRLITWKTYFHRNKIYVFLILGTFLLNANSEL